MELGYVRGRLTWARGEARLDGDDIVLDGAAAEEYAAFNHEHAGRLLFDLANLAKLGEISEVEDPNTLLIDAVRITDTGCALEFAKTHGLLWHGPGQAGRGEVRESLKDWYIAGLELSRSTTSYMNIRRWQEDPKKRAEPVGSYMRLMRDAGYLERIAIPEDDNELLEWASAQLAENISRGMAGCTPILDKVGAGEFVLGNDPGSLVGAAYRQLAVLVSRKGIVRECRECGELFPPTDPRQWEHKKCGNRRRKRESRQRLKAEPSP